MKNTIWQVIGDLVMIPATVTAETELSYIAKSDHEFSTEFCYPKQYEGITWFWTEEEAEAEVKFRKSPEFRIQELQKELEKLQQESEV